MKNEDTEDRGASGSEVQENYDAAFDEAQGIVAPDAQTPAATSAAEANQKLVDDISPAITPGSEPKPADQENADAKPTDEAKPVEQPVAPEQSLKDDTGEQKWRTLQGIHKKDKETWEQKEKDYLAQLEAMKTSKEPDASQVPDTKDAKSKTDDSAMEGISDEEKALLKEYDEEFDTISKMEGLKRKAETARIMKHIDGLLSQLTQAVAPAITIGQEVSQSKHFDAIRSAHDDFETHRDNGSIQNWINTKPDDLKAVYQNRYNAGTPEQVIDLITTFKRENNIGTSNPVPSPNHAPLPNPAREAKKAALSVVTNRRGAVNLAQPSTDDFEGAFDETMAK